MLKPEKQVENEILHRCRELDLILFKIESKAVFSEKIGRYTHSQAPIGYPDTSGYFAKTGLAAFVEVKAKGKLKTIRLEQRRFLLSAIHNGCFAVCVDSFESLKTHVLNFAKLPPNKQKVYLIDALPKPRELKTPDFSF